MASAGDFFGGLLQAGGQVAGGIIGAGGGLNSGDFIIPEYDPRTDPLFTSVRREVLTPFGQADIRDVASFTEELAGRFRSSSMDAKTKRRALHELGEFLEAGPNASLIQPESPQNSPLSWGGLYLNAAFNNLGLTRDDVVERIQSDESLRARRDALAAEEGFGLQEDIIRGRLRTAQEAQRQLSAAGGFAASRTPQNQLQETLLARDNKMLSDLRDNLLVNANFGRLNQGEVFDTIGDAELNQDLRLFQQAVGVSNALQGSLSGATQQGQNESVNNQNAFLNAAQILAQQAMARNNIRNQTSLDNALSLANGVSSGSMIFGDLFRSDPLLNSGSSNQSYQQADQNRLENMNVLRNGAVQTFGSRG